MFPRMVLAFILILVMTSVVHASPLLDAIGKKDAGAVQAAIAAGGDVNERSGLKTPLIAALRGGSMDIVSLLLEAGADVNLGTASSTPLSVACSMARPDLVKLLLDKGADAKLAKNSLTPLHLAAEKGCLECAKLLIAAGADNNALTSDGTPALHLALAGGNAEVASYLRSVGYTPPEVRLDAALLAAADAGNGRKLFDGNCTSCHVSAAANGETRGPPLYGVIGRAKASVEGREYSDGMRAAGGIWTYQDLNAFLAAPAAAVPGTAMIFGTRLDERDRADVIAFLRSQHDNPPPLP